MFQNNTGVQLGFARTIGAAGVLGIVLFISRATFGLRLLPWPSVPADNSSESVALLK